MACHVSFVLTPYICHVSLRLSTMAWLKLSIPGSLRSGFHGIQRTRNPQVRCISQVVFRTDSTPRPAPSLSSRGVTLVPALYLHCVRRVSTTSSGWYESVADSAPVHFTEQLLISSQQTTMLPWWAGIICTTLALRTVVTLPLAVYQAAIIAKVLSRVLTKHLLYRISTCMMHFLRIGQNRFQKDFCWYFDRIVINNLFWLKVHCSSAPKIYSGLSCIK